MMFATAFMIALYFAVSSNNFVYRSVLSVYALCAVSLKIFGNWLSLKIFGSEDLANFRSLEFFMST